MSTIRTIVVALGAALALSSGATLVSAPLAHATPCSTTPTVYCSMYWADQVTAAAVYGSSNSQVSALQKSIQQLQLGVTVTGTFDDQTRAYVVQYQTSRGLSRTGLADAGTIAALRSGAGPTAVTTQSLGGKVPLKQVERKIAAPIPTAAPKAAPKPAPAPAPAPSQTAAAKAVAFAHQQLGKPYVYGATGPNSFDCSGLTGAAWKNAGVSVPRTSYSQLGGLRSVSKANLQPGDIVGFYSGGHVGLYVGGGYVIHASRPGVPIKKVPMSQMPFYKAVRPAG